MVGTNVQVNACDLLLWPQYSVRMKNRKGRVEIFCRLKTGGKGY
jgi:hypothetical protein